MICILFRLFLIITIFLYVNYPKLIFWIVFLLEPLQKSIKKNGSTKLYTGIYRKKHMDNTDFTD